MLQGGRALFAVSLLMLALSGASVWHISNARGLRSARGKHCAAARGDGAMPVANSVPPILRRPACLLFGDSLTERSMDSEYGWGAALAHHFGRKFDIINRGFGGVRAACVRARARVCACVRMCVNMHTHNNCTLPPLRSRRACRPKQPDPTPAHTAPRTHTTHTPLAQGYNTRWALHALPDLLAHAREAAPHVALMTLFFGANDAAMPDRSRCGANFSRVGVAVCVLFCVLRTAVYTHTHTHTHSHAATNTHIHARVTNTQQGAARARRRVWPQPRRDRRRRARRRRAAHPAHHAAARRRRRARELGAHGARVVVVAVWVVVLLFATVGNVFLDVEP
jgi:hypothetical protein